MTRSLYPKLSCYESEMLNVGDGHEIYVEEAGNKDGIPVIYLHGGPGTGCSEAHRQFFDPNKYRIILFDQRGCGRSTPAGSIENNTTTHLLADMEKIRKAKAIDSWVVYGGSWGATLALLYAIEHASSVSGVILRGVFLAEEIETDWLFSEGGVSEFYPEPFLNYKNVVNKSHWADIANGYFELFQSDNELQRNAALIQWSLWEEKIASFDVKNIESVRIDDKHGVKSRSRVSNHYLRHRYFIEEGQIMSQCDALGDIPVTIVHGRFDMICRVGSAFKLAAKLNNASLQIIPHAGHSAFDKGIVDALIKATDSMADFISSK